MLSSSSEIVMLSGGATEVHWRRNDRARQVSLRIDPRVGRVVITLPSRASRQSGLQLLIAHAEWVQGRLAALPRPVLFVDGALVPLNGVEHRIVHATGGRGVQIANGIIHVAGGIQFLPRRVKDFFRAEARRQFAALAVAKAGPLGVAPRRVSVKDTSSRWGSCTSQRDLAFSWRLLMAPEFVQDYVVAHEVAHLRHMNHSALFWGLVDVLTEHRGTAIGWLRREGAHLMRIG